MRALSDKYEGFTDSDASGIPEGNWLISKPHGMFCKLVEKSENSAVIILVRGWKATFKIKKVEISLEDFNRLVVFGSWKTIAQS